MTAADLERVDVPLPDLERDIARIAAAATAENRHLLYDADADATVPPFVDLHHHLSTRRRAS